MAFDWREYLSLARALQTQAGPCAAQEAALRSATSRAYYGAFCHARNHAQDKLQFKPTRTGSDHALVRKHLETCGRAKVARQLLALSQWRSQCDYDDVVLNLSPMVATAIIKAQAVVADLV